jgi:hypothetical protein
MKELISRQFPIELFDSTRLDRYTGVIFSKCYDPVDQDLAARLRAGGSHVVLDLCDNHFYNPYDLPAYRSARENLRKMIQLADLITCSTQALAEIVAEEAGLPDLPEVVGDPVEFSDAALSPDAKRTRSGRLLWFGVHGSPNAPCGVSDLAKIADALSPAAQEFSFELVVCSNSAAAYERHVRPLGIASSYVEYNRNQFPALLAEMDGVILPIAENPFTRAKSHNRLTTALFAGVPVVADSIPSYREFSSFCVLDNWAGGLRELYEEPEKARARALAGRNYIEATWMPRHVAGRWQELLSPLLSRKVLSSKGSSF